jgi:hypothetical protein
MSGDNVDTGVTAIALRGGYNIGASTKFTQISTCGAANGVTLPANPILNQSTLVRNDGANSASVWPSAAGDQINALGGGNPYALAVGTAVRMFCTANTAGACVWYSEAVSAPQPVTAAPVIAAANNADLTLNISQTGSLVTLPAIAANQVVNLPAVGTAAGVSYKFRAIGTLGHTWTVTPTTSVMAGNFVNNNAAYASVAKAASASFVFTALAVNGDWAEVVSDGVKWFCSGSSSVVGFA